MQNENHKDWLELCNAAVEEKDPHELLRILRELDQALEREQQIRRESRTQTCGDRKSLEQKLL